MHCCWCFVLWPSNDGVFVKVWKCVVVAVVWFVNRMMVFLLSWIMCCCCFPWFGRRMMGFLLRLKMCCCCWCVVWPWNDGVIVKVWKCVVVVVWFCRRLKVFLLRFENVVMLLYGRIMGFLLRLKMCCCCCCCCVVWQSKGGVFVKVGKCAECVVVWFGRRMMVFLFRFENVLLLFWCRLTVEWWCFC